MIISKKQANLIKKMLILAVVVLVFEFSTPVYAQAGEINGSLDLGPTLVQLTNPNDITIQSELNTLPDLTDRQPKYVRWVTVTAYSSRVQECDDTPFITANGKWVYDGLIAANFLPFGTVVKMPDYFGDKVFTVNDRMNKKYNSRVDVWMSDTNDAIQFGARYLKIEVY